MESYIPLVIAVSLVVSGCGRKDDTRSDVPQSSPVQRQDPVTSASALPDRPAPDSTKGGTAEYPKPGQVNNHSSPEFKGGGEPAK